MHNKKRNMYDEKQTQLKKKLFLCFDININY